MIQQIRTSKVSKVVACYIAMQLIIQMVQPTAVWALTGGPKQPEFNSFTPIGTSDMVDLSSGDFSYNIPVMDVGGYPLNLAYNSGITMDQEASWVGLGWNLSVGQINRNVRGLPDDFKGDLMQYQDNIKDNVTVGVGVSAEPQFFGLEAPDQVGVKLGATISYNNYTGISITPSLGLTFGISESVSAGISLEGNAMDGPTVSPSLSLKGGLKDKSGNAYSGALNLGVSYNSTRGLSNLSISQSVSSNNSKWKTYDVNSNETSEGGSFSSSGRISFSSPTMTPQKRNAYRDIAGTLAVSVGPSVQGVDFEGEFSASASVQKIKNKNRTEKAYGYDFTGYASSEDIIDYNREKDQTISKSLKALPVTNYTYDTYSVQAQGIGGQFRPYRSQVGFIYDEYVKDKSEDFNLGVEIEGGAGFHIGANFTGVRINSSTGVWNTKATSKFVQAREDSEEKFGYEPVYYKYVGEHRVDKDLSMYEDELGGDSPIKLKISGSKFNKSAISQYSKKIYETKIDDTGREIKGAASYTDVSGQFNNKFKRSRDIRNQNVQKISRSELSNFYSTEYLEDWKARNNHGKDHHTSEIRVLKADGSTYVFGETAYNITKEETTFALPRGSVGDCKTGQISYSGGNSTGNGNGRDHYFSNVITPEYAHSYLVSAILSSDYEDITGDGPTEDDLGSYTVFEYEKKDDAYQWRVPYNLNKANFNAGLNTDKKDEKGSYIYGKKEIKYVSKIYTKTHVALFDLSPRKDGWGTASKNGGKGTSRMYQLDKVRLYSLPEAKAAGILDDDKEDLPISPIKTAHFEYTNDLCKGIDNAFDDDGSYTGEVGKLTLDKVYFTYRDSHMGKYTPYNFNYDGFNPDYNVKAYDLWGNYKPNEGECTTQGKLSAPEFPFVDQEDEDLQDQYASAWSLTSIDLPSGGRIKLDYETDDYQYVQDQQALQMFKVVGLGDGSSGDVGNNRFYTTNFSSDATHVYVELPIKVNENDNGQEFKQKYMKGIQGKPIYFRFLMNMTIDGAKDTSNSRFDYVTGYFNYEGSTSIFSIGDKQYAAIKTKFVKPEGGALGGLVNINPINKAALFFARRYLKQHALNMESDKGTDNVETVARKLIGSVGMFADFLAGPNIKLRGPAYQVGRKFVPGKSWIRLSTPRTNKLGGGSRVKSLKMLDNWDKMLAKDDSSYANEYGQTYDYSLDDGSTSGVASYEPNSSAENPLVVPFYNDADDDLLAPRELNYVEKPFGSSFFPGSKVTYSKVTVANLEREGIEKHATGKVVTEHFTTKDYPTKYDYTDLNPDYQSNANNILGDLIKGIFGIPIFKQSIFTLSQGYVIRTNDMDGKMKSQSVYAQDKNTDDEETLEPISTVTYKYSTKENVPKELDNKLPVIYQNGVIEEKAQLGVDYDVVNDFRRSFTQSETLGIKTNIAFLIIPLPPFTIPIPSGFPTYVSDKNIAHSAITTKVIHTTAIQTEKTATDLGATVTTTNEAWDAQTGQVLLTKTVNEYNDQYYNLNMPAYWNYENMGLASNNIGVKGTLIPNGSYYSYQGANVSDYFTLGDEIAATTNQKTTRLWVVGFNSSKTAVSLMDRFGAIVEDNENISFEIIRSGYRNQQLANMASLTLMKNPLKNNSGNFLSKLDTELLKQQTTEADKGLKIVNASAITYKDFWNCQCERGLPSIDLDPNNPDQVKSDDVATYGFNPYLFNVSGDWRADKSYAYLTERTDVNSAASTAEVTNLRKEGFFKDFVPYYSRTSNGDWNVESSVDENWTFASEVKQFNPYGVELENKDALDRFSSAQYGYNYTLPTAVASNTQYRQMGADNMEDYNYEPNLDSRFTIEDPGVSARFTNLEDHFNFKKAAQDDGSSGVQISDDFAHTGMNSLLVPNSDSAPITRPLVEELAEDLDADDDGINDVDDKCPYTKSRNNSDYDGDGIGDVCDDDALPEIYASGIEITADNVKIHNMCWGKRAVFTVNGKPNSVVSYKIVNEDSGRRGWSCHVNNEHVATHNTASGTRELKLDVTGQACVMFDVNANRGTSSGCCRWRTKKNKPKVSFILLHTNGGRIYSSPKVTLKPVGYRGCHSGTATIECNSFE